MEDTAARPTSACEPERGNGDYDAAAITLDVLGMLTAYEKAGVATRDGLADVPADYDPARIMGDFQSIIVLARVPKDPAQPGRPGRFHHAIGTIAAQDAVISYLKERGFKADMIGSRTTRFSLPRMGERAGVGELSPVGTLAVKGHGLRTVLSAIITNAPLEPSPRVSDACAQPDRCLRKCSALRVDGVFDRNKCSSCGACVKACPSP